MASSMGLLGHDYAAASSYLFPPELAADNNGGAVLEFPPAAAAMADYFLPEMTGARAPDCYYYCSPPAPAFANGGAAENNEMVNMGYVDDDGWRRSGGGRRAPPRIGFRTRSEVDVLDDGFKWRKYGKKAVKSSPNPRNYYRCSSEGCGVKKRVERDREDTRYVITTYDGVHNHAAPGAAAQLGGGVTRPAACSPAAPVAAASWSSAPGVGAPCNDDPWWGTTQLHATVVAAAAHSSESSY